MSGLHTSPETGGERHRLSWFERVCAFGVQLISAGAMIAVVNLVALPLSTTAAQASVAGAMDSYFDDMGAAANVTGPTAFDGQRAGYYSLGNVWTRFPQRTTNLANLQLPSARAGCGGIDLFAGSFSFVNSAEIIALLKSVANNAVGFAFKLAIDTVCPECSKIMEEMRQAAQLMNNANINSCETAQALVGGLWPKSDMADRSANRSAAPPASSPIGRHPNMAAATRVNGPRRLPASPATPNGRTSTPVSRATTPGMSSRNRRSLRRAATLIASLPNMS
jgi:hypothetical protein